MDKIRLKGGRKHYKAGPGLTGRARFEHRLRVLLIAVHRFALKDPQGREAAWAMRVVDDLQRLVRLP